MYFSFLFLFCFFFGKYCKSRWLLQLRAGSRVDLVNGQLELPASVCPRVLIPTPPDTMPALTRRHHKASRSDLCNRRPMCLPLFQGRESIYG
ncbi:hypothetical protein B0T16DRAFT_405572 [Cercophora newfieldiana]|uniref:Uncharacterized protein n=1 Tax=Cercophora newfieldiana TaxID=92897 RepID=A0AA39YGX2_9PEZI|nr:hypothetical protein B0T16DRAFT_405572 [Cercophora newfieldiana]